jgi:hypothetical protein
MFIRVSNQKDGEMEKLLQIKIDTLLNIKGNASSVKLYKTSNAPHSRYPAPPHLRKRL